MIELLFYLRIACENETIITEPFPDHETEEKVELNQFIYSECELIVMEYKK